MESFRIAEKFWNKKKKKWELSEETGKLLNWFKRPKWFPQSPKSLYKYREDNLADTNKVLDNGIAH